MDESKISSFINNKQSPFPSFRTLCPAECHSIYECFFQKVGSCEIDASVFDIFQNNGQFIEQFNALDDSFNIQILLSYLRKELDTICINWDEFESIDQMKFSDFCDYFDDIWYPIAEDMILFPLNMSFLIMIRHDGALFMIE